MTADTSRNDYAPLFAAIEKKLQERAHWGKPLAINIWDGNHTSPVPREIFSDPELLKIAGKYGDPVLIVEDAAGETLNRMVADYKEPANRERIQGMLNADGRVYNQDPVKAKAYGVALIRVFEHAREGVPVYYPDPREKNLEEAHFSPDEKKALATFIGTISTVPGQCVGMFTKKYRDHLSPEEQSVFDSAGQKFLKAAQGGKTHGDHIDTTEVDTEIARRVKERYPEHGQLEKPLFITLYGAGHYSKNWDLDEHFKGISVTWAEKQGVSMELYRSDPKKHQDLPDLVYYSDDRRVVELNTSAARAEFLGLTLEEYGKWEQAAFSRTPPADYKAPEMPDTIREECEAATAALTPYPYDGNAGMWKVDPPSFTSSPAKQGR